ncbi:hypothetical protein MGMO_88c00430 [Methyloglobulus morosus KoM1]|uniref:Predicted pPIWI-associating nuclease domain-containing protein n=1 Tax=Methyloglobulus morosus KoM1 TaxID=1116472 RepID=V5DWW2_9GAMM|nr:hypothetical protein [Methyloglobulus morosus]ESS71831.1 hypothetical protein MGMO_88c00430 [Methyloglobulus morosus KoM1]
MNISAHTIRSLKFAILGILSSSSPSGINKINLVGRNNQPGHLEHHLDCAFESTERVLAIRAFDELKADGLIYPTMIDLIDPESWVTITDRGKVALDCHALDSLDEKLQQISPHLVDIRAGAWSAVASQEPDALRQAAHSGRELIDQTIKEVATDAKIKEQPWYQADASSRSGITRRHRIKYIMQTFRKDDSQSNLKIADKARDLVLAIDDRLMGLAHTRDEILRTDVQDALLVAEIALRRLLLGKENNS